MIDFAAAREAMVDGQVRPSDVTRYPIIDAMLTVPREDFVPTDLRAVAYQGAHVPLGGGRVLLDPRTFGKMVDALELTGSDLVLDVGCGLGYSTAVLARIAEAVVALEEDPDMARQAEAALGSHDVDNAMVISAPFSEGVEKHGPFDVIVIEGGVETVPDELAEQLKPGGRAVAVFVEDGRGQVRLGIKTASGIGWRRIFDGVAPLLPGFERTKAFEF